VRKRVLTLTAVAVVTVLLASLFAALGGSSASAAPKAFSACLVTDIGGLNDKSFNHLAYVGLQAAQKSGVKGRVIQSNSPSQYIPNLSACAKSGAGITIGVGFLMTDAMDAVATAFPKSKFAIVDVDVTSMKHKPQNVQGLLFKEQEAGYLVGYIAGLMIHLHPHNGKQIVSAVGANPVPAIVHYLAGFQAGAKKANKHVKVFLNMANDPTFNDQTKCKVTTQNQISRGSGIVFEAAGGCGLGGLSAAKQAHIWGIGVDADQGFLGPFMLTSALKKVQVGVYDIIKQFKNNPSSIKGNADTTFTVKNHGVGYAPLSKKVSKKDRALITKKVNAIAKKIAKGKIKVPTTYPGA
jgi:basic membrane protein A and related proteins